ncbi:MAG: type IV secretory system conjugative DNA transfer family protein [Acidimicrobiales bacterium]
MTAEPLNGSSPAAKTTGAPEEPPPPPPVEWLGLYLGYHNPGPVTAGRENSLLVLGPPRSGKTSSVVVPNLLVAPGAAVSTSTKPDVLSVTGRIRRRRGTCWLFDPGGSLGTIEGTRPLRWSPVSGCEEWNTAVSTAHALVGATRTDRDFLDSTYWRERAESLLAPLLHAAALVGLDVGWVLRWVLRRDAREAVATISSYGNPLAADVLENIMEAEERERSGVFSTAANVLGAYRSEAALDAAREPNFDPWSFVRSSDTVYVCAPGSDQDQLAPLVVALLDQIRRATYARPSGWPPVVWLLDELANIAPLPDLPKIVSEGGGQGLVTLACLQDLSQARTRWGAAADGFLSLFRFKLVLPGIADGRTLELISQLAGEMDVVVRSVTRPRSGAMGVVGALLSPKSVVRPTVTDSLRRQRRMPVDEISRGEPGAGLVVAAGDRPGYIGLTPWWERPWRLSPDGSVQPPEPSAS